VLRGLHKNSSLQLWLGLLFGIIFGFLLQKGGVTRYEIILGQLLLVDWTVLKVIFTAVLTGMLGIFVLTRLGLARKHKKSGSIGRTVIGGLIFGLGFGLLGYCPGTGMGAVGQGSIDALIGGVGGIILGAASFAAVYPKVKDGILKMGSFGDITLPDLIPLPEEVIVILAGGVFGAILFLMETLGS
jgi:hypothetical protein